MGAGRMARVTRTKRVAKAKTMSRRIKGLAKASRKYVSMGLIERAGSQAAGTYGHQITGASGTYRQQCRRRLGHTLSSAKRG
eukprot:4728396-Pyramimonas_sp.AAC.1